MRNFSYIREGKQFVSVNEWVAKRRNDGARKSPVIGNLVDGKLVYCN